MRIKIWIPGAIDVSRTVRIEYTVRNALRFFDPDDSNFEAGHDELYWNVTGDEWEVPIQVASAHASDCRPKPATWRRGCSPALSGRPQGTPQALK